MHDQDRHARGREREISRRGFLRSSALAGAGAAAWTMTGGLGSALAQSGGDEVNVAIIGAGEQGKVLLRDSLKIPGLRFRAVCDIWKYSQLYGSGIIRKAGQDKPNVYLDYREMLAKEKDLDAVIVATPDWMHAEHAVACMKAGLHVYCEKEMSNQLTEAARTVQTARETGKVCQIGHQRRSNPVYLLALEALRNENLCGRVTNCYGQWNRAPSDKLGWPERFAISDDVLETFGYESMDHFRNWRWYKKYSAGPIADLGSHQIDIFAWFLGAEPATLMASGSRDYYEDRYWYGDVMTMYTYHTTQDGKDTTVQAFYQVLNTSGFAKFFERFLGDAGTLTISENPRQCYYVPEFNAEMPAWIKRVEQVDKNEHRAYPLVDALKAKGGEAARLIDLTATKTIHQWHLENFFAAVRRNDPKAVTCPPEVAYPTAVAVLSAIPAIEKGGKVTFEENDYKA